MSRSCGRALLVGIVMAVSCAGETRDEVDTKEEARLLGGRADDGTDYCALYDWYGDGVCDTFCVDPDPDCNPCVEAGGKCLPGAAVECPSESEPMELSCGEAPSTCCWFYGATLDGGSAPWPDASPSPPSPDGGIIPYPDAVPIPFPPDAS